MPNAKKILICLIPIIISGTAPANDFYGGRGSDAFGIMDKHFQGVLFPEAYKNLASAKIAYPGLWTSDKNAAAVGLLPGQSGPGWQGAYTWADISNGPGNAGFWLGNLSFADSYLQDYAIRDRYYMNASNFSMRGAAWITPFRGKRFSGLSVTVDIDNAFDDDSNLEHLFDAKEVFINLTALIRINDYCHLRAGVRTYNKISENDPSADRDDNSILYSDGVYIGLVDDSRRTLELRADNTFGMLHRDWEKYDTLSLGLQYTQGGALSYKKHMLFLGLKAEAGAAFISNVGEEIGSFAYATYLRNLTADGWILRAGVSAPIVLDINACGPLRCMLSIAPRVGYAQLNYPKRALHDFAMTLPEAELSLRGTIDDKFDFALKPTVSSDVFISALEIRYRF
jgi:hypothetical protein